MNIYLLFKTLSKRIWSILGIAVIASITAFLFTIGYEREYKSSTQLATGFTIKQAVRLTDDNFNLYEINVKFDNLLETLNSTTVIGLLSYDLLIHDLTNSAPFREPEVEEPKQNAILTASPGKTIDILQTKLDSLQLLTSFNKEEKNLLELLKLYRYDYKSLSKMLRIYRINLTDYVAIECVSENPELSAYIVNTFCKQFLRYNETMRLERSNESVKFFANLVQQKKNELEAKSQMLRQYKSDQGVINFGLESESKLTQIAEYESSLENEEKKHRSLSLSLENMDQQLDKILAKVSSENANVQVLDIRENIRKLNDRYIQTGSDDDALLQEITELRSRLNQVLSEISQYSSQKGDIQKLTRQKNDTEVQVKIAAQNINALKSTLSRLKTNVGEYASKEAQIQELEREAQLASEEYIAAQEKYNSALNVLSASSSDIKHVLFGQPAVEPEPSQQLIITGLAGASTFVLLIIGIAFMEYMDFSLKTPSNFVSSTGLTLLGKINHLKNAHKGQKAILQAEKPDSQQKLFKELTKKIRYEIETSKKQVILISSTRTGQGKTTFIESMVNVLSLSRHQVLIIDANFQHNSLTQRYEANPVLENLCNKNQHESSDILREVKATDIPGVSILGCQGGDYSPSEILNAACFNSLLEKLRQQYDYIFLESSALNIYPDSKELMEYADALLVVFSATSTVSQTDQESIAYLKNMNGRFMGAILNNVEKENLDS